jgi:hypothetical protein
MKFSKSLWHYYSKLFKRILCYSNHLIIVIRYGRPGPKWSHLSGSILNSLLFQRMSSSHLFLTLLAFFFGFVSIEANEIKSSRYQLPCKNNCSLNGGSYLYCETEQGWDYCSLQPGKSWAMILMGLG